MIAVPTIDETFLNQRRQAIYQHPTQIGLDYIDVQHRTPGSWYLWLYFVPAADTVPDKQVKPATLTTDNIRIMDVAGQLDLSMEVVEITFNPPDDPPDDQGQERAGAIRIEVREAERPLQSSSHSQSYTLQLINVPNLDPFFAQISFSLHVEKPGLVDSHLSLKMEPETAPTPNINYLARDYHTFHKVLLDRLSVIMPGWQERNPADIGMTLVEILAYAADYMSYYQDAVATEAYLGTARHRISVRRHARLLDYVIHEGCNARVWVQIQVSEQLFLAEKTPLMTRLPGQDTCISPQANQAASGVLSQYNQGAGEAPQVFETMHALTLLPAHNEMQLYTWGAPELVLPKGTTTATLRQSGDIDLAPGDILILEEVKDPRTGNIAGANLAHRHAIRLATVTTTEDAIGGALLGEESTDIPLIEVSWQAEDALPFDLCLSTVVNGNPVTNVSVARGNIVLADHGRTVQDEPLVPDLVPEQGRYRPRLKRANMSHGTLYDDELARTQPAATAMVQSPDRAVPLITLAAADDIWTPQKDLLNSNRFSLDFVVETDNDGVASLRFGDGEHGKRPVAGTALMATYRIGNGSVGNVGADSIAHVVSDHPGIRKVGNPLPAQGGIDPESLERVRRDAPQALRDQERAVTEADYAAIAARHPEVRRVASTLQWTGSWYTMFVIIDRANNRPVDAAFKDEMLELLRPFRLAGYDLEIRTPIMVSLDIEITVSVKPAYFRSTVRAALEAAFSSIDLPDRQRGFFHPDNFDFGQPVYLSQMVSRAMDVPGVAWVETTRFQRWQRPAQDELKNGEITIGPFEIARLRNDPEAPEDGVMRFHLEGGQ